MAVWPILTEIQVRRMSLNIPWYLARNHLSLRTDGPGHSVSPVYFSAFLIGALLPGCSTGNRGTSNPTVKLEYIHIIEAPDGVWVLFDKHQYTQRSGFASPTVVHKPVANYFALVDDSGIVELNRLNPKNLALNDFRLKLSLPFVYAGSLYLFTGESMDRSPKLRILKDGLFHDADLDILDRLRKRSDFGSLSYQGRLDAIKSIATAEGNEYLYSGPVDNLTQGVFGKRHQVAVKLVQSDKAIKLVAEGIGDAKWEHRLDSDPEEETKAPGTD
jgi:hypothetical protein